MGGGNVIEKQVKHSGESHLCRDTFSCSPKAKFTRNSLASGEKFFNQ